MVAVQSLNSMGGNGPDFEPLSLDELIDRALALSGRVPAECALFIDQVRDLHDRLAHGHVRIAVLGQFNRGKSTFLNALLGHSVLPVSVLPLTSVPTFLKYGLQFRCTIRFSDGKPPVVESESDQAIGRVLQMYVTEEANPENRLAVQSAELEYPSDVLMHGTILIDTPGFGSTFAHNTRTTFDLIAECDAAVLLLSADLPITQAEIDFLRELHRFVPRIFFVYNKIDLLNSDDLILTQRFITTTLAKNLSFLDEPQLYPVCARKALDKNDPTVWAASGMEKVKTGIIDFLLRDKFFALSHGLNKKFREAVTGIAVVLEHRRSDLAAPIETARAEADAVAGLLTTIQRTSAEWRSVGASERKALMARLDAVCAVCRPRLAADAAAVAGDVAGQPRVSEAVVRSVCARFFKEAFDRVLFEVVVAMNREIRPIAVKLEEAFERLRTNALASGRCERLTSMAAPSLASIEVPQPEGWVMADPSTALAGVRFSLFDAFARPAARVALMQKRLEGPIKEIIEINMLRMVQSMQVSVASALDVIDRELARSYNNLTGALAEESASRKKALDECAGRTGEELDGVEKSLQEIALIQSQLTA